MLQQAPGSYYRPSGQFSLTGAVMMLAAGLAAGIVLGAIYGALSWWNPFVYFTVIGAALAGAGAGFVAGLAGKKGKVRNASLAVVGGLAGGVAVEYSNLVGYVWAISGTDLIVVSPAGVLGVMSEIGHEGAWSIFGWTPTGGALWAIWGLEAIIILGAAALVALGVLSEPFCERCGLWVEGKRSLGPFASIDDTAAFKTTLEAGDWAQLERLQLAASDASSFTELELKHCEGCSELHLLTVNSVTVEIKDNKEEKEAEVILQDLILDKMAYGRISTMERITPAPSSTP